jgi:sec-independent protein translocase protein TatA
MFARLFDSPWSIVVIVLVIVLLFGWKRLPDAARSLGRSMRIFKSEVQQMTDKDDQPSAASTDTVRGEAGHHGEDAKPATEAEQRGGDQHGGDQHGGDQQGGDQQRASQHGANHAGGDHRPTDGGDDPQRP